MQRFVTSFEIFEFRRICDIYCTVSRRFFHGAIGLKRLDWVHSLMVVRPFVITLCFNKSLVKGSVLKGILRITDHFGSPAPDYN